MEHNELAANNQEINMDIDGRIEMTTELHLQAIEPEFPASDNIALAMFSPSFPVNPIPFAVGLARFVKENGSDSIKADDAKQILWILMAQAYGQLGTVDIGDEWNRLWNSIGKGKMAHD
jgi:hypothetical protein